MNRILSHYSLTFLLVVLALGIEHPAQAWYIGKEEFAGASLNDDVLSHYNYAAGCDDVNLITTHVQPNSGERPVISVEITNLNCREGKSYPVYYRTTSGEKKTYRIEHPEWGILWGYRDTDNFHALLLRTGRSDPRGYDPPTMQYCIFTVAEGDTIIHTPWSDTTPNYLNPEDEYNHLYISPIDGGFEIFIGAEREYRLGICADDRLFGNQAGIYVGSGANIILRNWKLQSCPYNERAPFLTEEEIYNHLNGEKKTYEGIYELIGSSSSSLYIRLGGQYRLALIHTGNEYRLLYLSGAQRAADLWEPGMVKAIFTPLAGGNLFRVTWYDANHNPISEEVKASCASEAFRVVFSLSGTTLNFIKSSLQPPLNKERSEGPFRLL